MAQHMRIKVFAFLVGIAMFLSIVTVQWRPLGIEWGHFNTSFLRPLGASGTEFGSLIYSGFHNLVRNYFIPTDEHKFLKVGNTSLYVISAFWDQRLDPEQVQFFGIISQTEDPSQYWCHFYNGSKFLYTMPAYCTGLQDLFSERFGLTYRVVFGNCSTGVPALNVSVSTNNDTLTSGLLHLKRVGRDTQPPRRLGLCSKTLFSYTDDELGIFLEYIELQRLLGVEKFIIYDMYECSAVIQRAMQLYASQGIVEVVPWQLPLPSHHKGRHVTHSSRWQENPDDSIKYAGQVAALNDCVYRNMDQFELLMIVDYDEFIIPEEERSVFDLVARIQRETDVNNIQSEFVFENAQFCDSIRYDNITEVNRVTASHYYYINRRDPLIPKAIVSPRKSLYVNAHGVVQAVAGFETKFMVPKSQGRKHHYRAGTVCPETFKSTNTTDRFQRELQERILSVKQKLT